MAYMKPVQSPSHKSPSYHMRLCTCFFLLASITFVIFQIQAFKTPFTSSITSSLSWAIRTSPSSSSNCSLEIDQTRSRLRDSVTFLPLKDPGFADDPREGRTWFISSMDDILEKEETQYLYFPSNASHARLLCLAGNDTSKGVRNSYALAWPDALPDGATLLKGLTLVSDTYYDHSNIWHGLSAVMPFAAWHKKTGCGDVPERWVLYHWGELRMEMATWIKTLMEVTMGSGVRIEKMSGGGGRPKCFERAVVFRHDEGAMARHKKEEVYDLMRCKARRYCNISPEGDEEGMNGVVRLTLLLRVGTRSFKDEAAVAAVMEEHCRKADACRLRVARSFNLSFCDQVKLMTETDLLATAHGAQMTNMIFMDKNSSIMEFFPKGWLELAGAGQYVFRWLADWSGMRHQGSWWDSEGKPCPYSDNAQCFSFYKNGQIGLDENFLANWTSRVLAEVKEYKLSRNSSGISSYSRVCPCS